MTTPKKQTPPPTWTEIDEDALARIGFISDWQESKSLSDEKFMSGCTVSATTWFRIKQRSYAGDVLTNLELIERHFLARKEQLSGAAEIAAKTFFETSKYMELRSAVANVKVKAERGHRDRIVWRLGRTGWGKTADIKHLRDALGGGVIVTARESWRNSYWGAVTSMASALAVRPPMRAGTSKARGRRDWRSVTEVEGAVLQRLALRPELIFVDEFEYLGRHVKNLLRSILNETSSQFVISCLPTSYENLAIKGGDYTEQLISRTEAVIESGRFTSELAGNFLKEHWQNNSATDECSGMMSDEANRFGGFHACERLTAFLRATCKARAPRVPDMHNAVDFYRKFVRTRAA